MAGRAAGVTGGPPGWVNQVSGAEVVVEVIVPALAGVTDSKPPPAAATVAAAPASRRFMPVLVMVVLPSGRCPPRQK